MGNLKNISRLVAAAFLFAAMLAGCQQEMEDNGGTRHQYPLRLTFNNFAGTEPLALNTPYTNPHGEDITITMFKYYVSNISLVDVAGNETKLPNTYFLIDQNTPSSASFELTAPGSEYKAIHFLLGVDSLRNVTGVQTGALDPANAMFWTWSTGYIMAKMEGTSTKSTAPFSGVTYHIGGFKTGESALRTVTLNLPENVVLKTTATSEIVIDGDAMKWFKGVHDIKIATDAFCMNPGALAMNIADNYAEMFSVKEVKNQ
jgi:hypothetical protein